MNRAGFEQIHVADIRGYLGVLPHQWPSRDCRVDLYGYMAGDLSKVSAPIEDMPFGMATRLQARVIIDLSNGRFEFKQLEPTEPLEMRVFEIWSQRGFSRESEDLLIESVRRRDPTAMTPLALDRYRIHLDAYERYASAVTRDHAGFMTALRMIGRR